MTYGPRTNVVHKPKDHLMSVLIIKLGATGDVVRTTPLLRRFDGPVSWVTAENNLPLLEGIDRESVSPGKIANLSQIPPTIW